MAKPEIELDENFGKDEPEPTLEAVEQVEKVRVGMDFLTDDKAIIRKLRIATSLSEASAGKVKEKIVTLGLAAYTSTPQFKQALKDFYDGM